MTNQTLIQTRQQKAEPTFAGNCISTPAPAVSKQVQQSPKDLRQKQQSSRLYKCIDSTVVAFLNANPDLMLAFTYNVDALFPKLPFETAQMELERKQRASHGDIKFHNRDGTIAVRLNGKWRALCKWEKLAAGESAPIIGRSGKQQCTVVTQENQSRYYLCVKSVIQSDRRNQRN